MGLGYHTCEEVIYDPTTGENLTFGTWKYKVPLAKDIPRQFNIKILHDAPNPYGVLSSKGNSCASSFSWVQLSVEKVGRIRFRKCFSTAHEICWQWFKSWKVERFVWKVEVNVAFYWKRLYGWTHAVKHEETQKNCMLCPHFAAPIQHSGVLRQCQSRSFSDHIPVSLPGGRSTYQKRLLFFGSVFIQNFSSA